MPRTYNRNPDPLRAVKSVGSSIALLSMYINKSTAEQDFVQDLVEDLSDVLSLLNDNHFRGFIPDEETGELILHAPHEYTEARRRKAHQNRAIIEKLKKAKDRQMKANCDRACRCDGECRQCDIEDCENNPRYRHDD